MNFKKIHYFKEEYKARFEEIHLQEIYKWKAFKCFQDNWDINSSEFVSTLKKSLEKTANLLVSGNYWPRLMLLENAEVSENEVQELFHQLVREETDLSTRILDFQKGMKTLSKINFPEKRQVYQDHRAILVYLCLIYPERYYLYKYKMFRDFAEIVDYSYKPVRGRIANIGQYLNMCDMIRNELEKDQELLKLHKNRIIDEDCYYDNNHTLLTQDFIYAVAYHFLQTPIADQAKNIPQSFSFPKPVVITEENIIVTNKKSDFKPRIVDWIGQQKQNHKDGASGEAYVIRYETDRLKKLGFEGKVVHTSVEAGDGTGYDIESLNEDGNVIFIEVKTTKGKCSTPFHISQHQLKRSIQEKDNYYLYRLFNYDKENDIYEIRIINGDLTKYCQTPENYLVSVKEK
jgi:hypothetical protein